ncbi:hypothetical protein M911_02095 [Ectothiorhodospira haloalkaliphila]|uniref:Uncharacterized protein n=1 Tax=Ectothiorhodospira haloalkaliphila TaxID=421628 RepID=W8KLB4_9GAMM|nr:hypothetical protein M911_02095 [Ectothiorhodospira haloalkaliphila]
MEQGGHGYRIGPQIMLPGDALRLTADRQQSPPADQQRLVDYLQGMIQQPSQAGMVVSLGGGQLLHEAGVLPDGPQYQGLVMQAGQAGQPGDLGQHGLAVCGVEKGLGVLEWYQARWRSNRVRVGKASA